MNSILLADKLIKTYIELRRLLLMGHSGLFFKCTEALGLSPEDLTTGTTYMVDLWFETGCHGPSMPGIDEMYGTGAGNYHDNLKFLVYPSASIDFQPTQLRRASLVRVIIRGKIFFNYAALMGLAMMGGLSGEGTTQLDRKGGRVLQSGRRIENNVNETVSVREKHDVPQDKAGSRKGEAAARIPTRQVDERVLRSRTDKAVASAPPHMKTAVKTESYKTFMIPEIHSSPMPSQFPEVYVHMELGENMTMRGSDGGDLAGVSNINGPDNDTDALTHAKDTAASELSESNKDGPLLTGLRNGKAVESSVFGVRPKPMLRGQTGAVTDVTLQLWAVAIELEMEGVHKGKTMDPSKRGPEYDSLRWRAGHEACRQAGLSSSSPGPRVASDSDRKGHCSAVDTYAASTKPIHFLAFKL
ncbi:hypothetical protein PAXINDRAFT_9460 [Paxillus involutus ATCC 200175]|nr:hypothetical protein PAXINDRAFT_9460 [Paxillus involutus ATCC 200175]